MGYHLPSEDRDDYGSTERSRHVRTRSGRATLGDRVSSIFDSSDRKDSLPMYKEKPYHYPGSRRRLQWLKSRRGLVGAALTFLAILYWSGLFSSSPSPRKPARNWLAKSAGSADWAARQQRVKEVFQQSWHGYEKYAWGYDEYKPHSKTGRHMVPGGMGWIIVDALDTLMLMNLTRELTHAREWMATSLSYDKDHDINTFETTIRMLGGLLAAHYISSEYPQLAPVKDKHGEDLYLEKATDLADRLSSAFDSKSGVPYASVNPGKRQGLASHDDGGASSTAEATTLQLELKYISKLTGEPIYWQKAEKVMQVVDDNGAQDGLVPIYIYADQGTFRGDNIRLGSRGDSFYEYLIKQYLQTSQEEPIYLDMWSQALQGMQKHLITYSKTSNLMVLGERPNGIDGALSPKVDHLVCFLPGTIALGATRGKTLSEARKHSSWGKQQEADMHLAYELTKTCWGMYKVTSTGLAPEIVHFKLKDPPVMHDPKVKNPVSPKTLAAGVDAEWRHDYDIHSNDVHNLQRPETVETLFYMWRITGDVKYREWGWEMFESFVKHTAMPDDAGYASINNVNQIPTSTRDNMESFWLVSTCHQ